MRAHLTCMSSTTRSHQHNRAWQESEGPNTGVWETCVWSLQFRYDFGMRTGILSPKTIFDDGTLHSHILDLISMCVFWVSLIGQSLARDSCICHMNTPDEHVASTWQGNCKGFCSCLLCDWLGLFTSAVLGSWTCQDFPKALKSSKCSHLQVSAPFLPLFLDAIAGHRCKTPLFIPACLRHLACSGFPMPSLGLNCFVKAVLDYAL